METCDIRFLTESVIGPLSKANSDHTDTKGAEGSFRFYIRFWRFFAYVIPWTCISWIMCILGYNVIFIDFWFWMKNPVEFTVGNNLFLSFQIDEALREAYIKVQTIAVALTYTVRNQVRNRGQFTEKFEGAYHYLRIVLCELETIMGDCSVAMPPNVEDDIIPSEFHHLDKTESKPYDFVVLREYIKTLNYVTKMLEHLKKGSQEIK